MLRGLIDSQGNEVRWADLAEHYDPTNWVVSGELTCGGLAHWPLAVLLGMARDETGRDQTTLHVSSLAQAPRVSRLPKISSSAVSRSIASSGRRIYGNV